MTSSSEILVDALGRIRDGIHKLFDDLPNQALTWRPDPDANTIAWLTWHLTRVQDHHMAAAFGASQLWHEAKWYDRFELPFDPDATGYGQGSDDVGKVKAEIELLRGYHDAVASRSIDLVSRIVDYDLTRVVDDRWDPPVTLAARIVSVIEDDLQHVGQAAYLKGLYLRGRSPRL